MFDCDLVGLGSHAWVNPGVVASDLQDCPVAGVALIANDHGPEDSFLHKHRTRFYRRKQKTGKTALRECIVVLKCGMVSRIDGEEAS